MSVSVKIVDSTENKLLNRREFNLILTHTRSSTPSKSEIIQKMATLNHVKPANVIVYDMAGRFGSHETKAKCKIYSNFEQLQRIENDYVVARITGEKKKKVVRRMRKDARKKKAKMFGSIRRNVKKAERKENK